jgi:hypothetical protein
MTRRLADAVAALDAHRAERDQADPDLFSAIESVADHAGDEWRDRALDLVHHLALTRDTFTVCHLDPFLPATVDKRAVGWVLRRGARNGWYEAAGYETGDRARHGRPVVRWRSRIFR